jgi:hypothetical protein
VAGSRHVGDLSNVIRGGSCVLALALALCCGGGGSPSAPTPSTSPPAPPATPPPAAASCPFGSGSAKTECSRRTPTELLSAIDKAIDLVAQQPAGILDLSNENPPHSRQYHILSQKAFMDALLANLRAAGFCAQPDYDFPLEGLSVKSSNDFSEDFVVVQWGEWVRRGPTSYVRNCKPAAFPVDPDPEWPPSGSGCGKPYPDPIHHFNAKVHIKGRDYHTLDSTPIVGPDANYCAAIGYTDGRGYCPVRIEGSRDRVECENWRVGKATDTGRPGPTWQYKSGGTLEYCQGLKVNGCENHPSNQYGLLAAKGGTYVMCAQNGACGEVVVDR